MSTLSEIAAAHALQAKALEAEPIHIATLHPAIGLGARLPHPVEQIPPHTIAAMNEIFSGHAKGYPG